MRSRRLKDELTHSWSPSWLVVELGFNPRSISLQSLCSLPTGFPTHRPPLAPPPSMDTKRSPSMLIAPTSLQPLPPCQKPSIPAHSLLPRVGAHTSIPDPPPSLPWFSLFLASDCPTCWVGPGDHLSLLGWGGRNNGFRHLTLLSQFTKTRCQVNEPVGL